MAKKEKKDKGSKSKGLTIKSKPTVDAINKVMKVLDNKVDTVQIEMQEDGMLVSASSDNSAIQLKVDECTGSGKFAVGIESFKHILSGRAELNCEIHKADLAFESGRYKGTLKVIPHMTVKVEGDSEAAVTIKSGSGLMDHFSKALTYLNLTISAVQDSDEGFIVVRVKDGEIVCATYDTFHWGVYKSKVDYKGKDLYFNFKTSILRKILALGDKTDFDLQIGQNVVFIETASINAAINMAQLDAKSFDIVLNLVEQARKNVTAKAEVSSDRVEGIVANMKGVFESDKTVNVQLTKKSMDWSYKTTYGTVEESMKVESKKDASIRIRLPMIEDVVGTMPTGDISFGIINETIDGSRRMQVFIQSGDFSYLVSGSQ